MKRIYHGIVVESSLPLDSTIFREIEPEKPTDPADTEVKQTKQTDARKKTARRTAERKE